MPTFTYQPPVRTLVASIPGGPARQYRVQIRPEGQTDWRMYASFRTSEAAQVCQEGFEAHGISARVVAVRMNPTAA